VDIHFNGSVAIEYAGEHRYTLLGKNIGRSDTFGVDPAPSLRSQFVTLKLQHLDNSAKT
jgi:hypothetical protein